MFSQLLTPALALLFTTNSLAFPSPNLNLPRSALTAAQILQISPGSSSCTGATHPTECRTASQAVNAINYAFQTYGITTPGEQAAVISTMAFESGDFKYQKHYFPSPNPGQGTRNMQSAEFNLKYAQSITALSSQISTAEAAGGDGVLDLLIANDDYDFGSAAWFITTQCSQSVRQQLQEGNAQGWGGYLECIGTTVTSDRTAYYTRATTTLGVNGGN